MASNGDHRGITRRASAASTTLPASVSSSTTRVHKTNESTHGFVGTHPTNPGPSYSPSVTRTPQGKIVLSLINRLSSKVILIVISGYHRDLTQHSSPAAIPFRTVLNRHRGRHGCPDDIRVSDRDVETRTGCNCLEASRGVREAPQSKLCSLCAS